MTGINYENIERYLSGDMSREERVNFEKELEQNHELADEMRFYEYVNRSISRALNPPDDEILFKSSLRAVADENRRTERRLYPAYKSARKPASGRVNNRLLKIISICSAAAAIVLCVFIWAPWRQSLVTQFADVRMASVVERGSGSEATIQEAIRLFNNQEYKHALPLFNQALQEQSDDTYLLFHRGIALLHTDELVAARSDMLRVYSSGSIYQHDAAFYIALTYAAANNRDDALRWLEYVPDDALIFQKAEALRKKL